MGYVPRQNAFIVSLQGNPAALYGDCCLLCLINSDGYLLQNQSDSMTYTQCHPNYNDSSPWVMWQDRTSTPVVSLKKGKCCTAVLGIAVFLAILSVMGIAGLAIYMGGKYLNLYSSSLERGSHNCLNELIFHEVNKYKKVINLKLFNMSLYI